LLKHSRKTIYLEVKMFRIYRKLEKFKPVLTSGFLCKLYKSHGKDKKKRLVFRNGVVEKRGSYPHEKVQ
jgi:hypothetical protein